MMMMVMTMMTMMQMMVMVKAMMVMMMMMMKAIATCRVSFAQDNRSSTRDALPLILLRISVVSLADASSMLPSVEASALLPDTLNLVKRVKKTTTKTR